MIHQAAYSAFETDSLFPFEWPFARDTSGQAYFKNVKKRFFFYFSIQSQRISSHSIQKNQSNQKK